MTSKTPPADLVAHAAFIRRMAWRMLGNDALADDAAQETLARAIGRPPRPGPGLSAWLRTVLLNVVRRGKRSDGRRAERERASARYEALPGAADAVARGELLRKVTDAVNGLEPAHREVVMLRHYEDLPPRAIAARTGLSVETVKKRLERAHDALRTRLDESAGGNVEGWRGTLSALAGLPGTVGTVATTPAAGTIAMPATGKLAVAVAAGVVLAITAWNVVPARPVGNPPRQGSAAGLPDDSPARLARAPVRAAPPRHDLAAELPADSPPHLAPALPRTEPPQPGPDPAPETAPVDAPPARVVSQVPESVVATVEVTGRVTEKEGGGGVAGAEISLSSVEGTPSAATIVLEETLVTDVGGTWRARLHAGTWQFEVRKKGFVQGETQRALVDGVAVPEAMTALLGARFTVAELPIELETFLLPAPAIVGFVLDSTGHPVANATVVVEGAGVAPDSPPNTVVKVTEAMQAKSAEDGSFRIEGMTIGAHYDLRAEAPDGEGTAQGIVFPAGESVARTEIRLAKPVLGGARLRGRIVDEQGRPIPGVSVVLGWIIRERTRRGHEVAGRALTGADGRFDVRNLKAGGHRAKLTAAGFAVTYSPTLEIGKDEDVRADDWVMPKRGLIARGHVTDVNGRPVAGIRVHGVIDVPTFEMGMYFWSALTDAEGRYEVESPAGPPCKVDVHVKPGGGFVYVVGKGLADPTAEIDLVVHRAATLRGRVTFRGPRPQKLIAWYLTDFVYSSGVRNTWYDRPVEWDEASGEYRVDGLPPGPREVFLKAAGFAPTDPWPIDLPDQGAATWAPIVMTPGGTLAARILDADGKPVVARVLIKGPWFLYTDSLGDGRLRLDHLPPGARTFTVDRLDTNDRNDPEFEAAIVEGQTSQVVWTLPPVHGASK